MKQSFDTYCLYSISKYCKYVTRNRFTLKEEVDPIVLKKAINDATRRYPYYMVKLTYDNDGSYVFENNELDIVVVPTSNKNPNLCSKEVNYHLIYADYDGKDVYFNFSHALAGGKGILPWLMTCMYQYVIEKYGVDINVPNVRKPGSKLLEGENSEARIKQFAGKKFFDDDVFIGRASMAKDYLSSFFNPIKSSNEYFVFEFEQNNLITHVKKTNNSVVSFFDILMFKMMDKVLPQEEKLIIGETAHNPAEELGVPNTRYNYLSHVLIPYSRDMADCDMSSLGLITREQIVNQIAPEYSLYEVGIQQKFFNEIDQIDGHKEKIKYVKNNNILYGKNVVHGTYIVNYSGHIKWGDLTDYIESYVHIVDGHQLLEISTLGDKIFCSYHQVIRTDKYINAFKKVLDDNNIEYKMNGPFKKNLCKHQI